MYQVQVIKFIRIEKKKKKRFSESFGPLSISGNRHGAQKEGLFIPRSKYSSSTITQTLLSQSLDSMTTCNTVDLKGDGISRQHRLFFVVEFSHWPPLWRNSRESMTASQMAPHEQRSMMLSFPAETSLGHLVLSLQSDAVCTHKKKYYWITTQPYYTASTQNQRVLLLDCYWYV